MLGQVRAPLLEVLRISPDFSPAYEPLLGMAKALAGSNALAARELLTELSRVVPARNEARALLSQLSGSQLSGSQLSAPASSAPPVAPAE
jgi:spermidine synthase